MTATSPRKRFPSLALLLALLVFPATARAQMTPQDSMVGMGAKTVQPAVPKPSQEMQPMPAPAAPAPSEPMGGMSTKPSAQGMEMAPDPGHQAGETEEAKHVSALNGGRILWVSSFCNPTQVLASKASGVRWNRR